MRKGLSFKGRNISGQIERVSTARSAQEVTDGLYKKQEDPRVLDIVQMFLREHAVQNTTNATHARSTEKKDG
jgi:hypothetical protein